jgi:hypothetical protein
MTETLRVEVTFSPACGYVSAASHRVPRSLTAPSLDGLLRADPEPQGQAGPAGGCEAGFRCSRGPGGCTEACGGSSPWAQVCVTLAGVRRLRGV